MAKRKTKSAAAAPPAIPAIDVPLAQVPWLQEPWARLLEARRSDRLAHALLVHGAPGLGKQSMVRALAALSLCTKTDTQSPCGKCRGCQLHAVGNHPDLHLICPEPDKRTISVDQVRELTRALGFQSHAGGATVALVWPAEAMTVNAANSLLKTLEEPTQNTLIVLISDRASRLMPTVRSRCQQIKVQPPTREDALSWLNQREPDKAWVPILSAAGGAPLAALAAGKAPDTNLNGEITRDLIGLASRRAEPIGLAKRWAAQDPGAVLASLQHIVLDVLRARAAPGHSGSGAIASEALRKRLQDVSAADLSDYLAELGQSCELLLGQANPLLVCESVLIGWARVTAPRRAHRGRAG